MKKSQKGFIVPLLLIIATVLVVGAGAYYYSHNQSDATRDSSKETTINSQLKLYTNTNFSIQYPSGWEVVEQPTGVLFHNQSDDKQAISVTLKSNKNISDVVAGYKKIIQMGSGIYTNFKEQTLTINGTTGTRIDFDAAESTPFHQTDVIFENPTKSGSYVIGNSVGMQDEALFTRVYSSFKLK